MVQYLAHHSKHEAGELSSAVLAANPVLEAFGCAVTTRNRNSSRFGKLMKIWTSPNSSTLNGSSIVTYLLEKGRVSHHAPQERSFHIFYYLLAAAAAGTDAPGTEWEGCEALCDFAATAGAAAFSYLRQPIEDGNLEEAASLMDSRSPADLSVVASALQGLGASTQELRSVWSLLAAILTLGNLRFDAESQDDDTAVLHEECEQDLTELARLLGVDCDILRSRLVAKTVCTGRGSNYVIRFSASAAAGCRDGLAHELYGRLFAWIVRVVNRSLTGQDEPCPGAGVESAASPRFIAILDIFGFENLEVNSLEQVTFCDSTSTRCGLLKSGALTLVSTETCSS